MNSLNLSEEVRRDTIDILHREEVTTRQLLTVITDEAKMLMPFFCFFLLHRMDGFGSEADTPVCSFQVSLSVRSNSATGCSVFSQCRLCNA